MKTLKKPRLYRRGETWWAYFRDRRWSLRTTDEAQAVLLAQQQVPDDPTALARKIVDHLRADPMLREYVRKAVWGEDLAALKREGFVYFIRCGAVVKIGYTREVQQRLEHMQTHNAEEVTLLRKEPGSITTERALHRRFRALRVRGEWYRLEGDLARYLNVDRPAPASAELGAVP